MPRFHNVFIAALNVLVRRLLMTCWASGPRFAT
jgi:hypothetical protein